MKVSELIDKLVELERSLGDVDVAIEDANSNRCRYDIKLAVGRRGPTEKVFERRAEVIAILGLSGDGGKQA